MKTNVEHYLKGDEKDSLPNNGWINPCINCNAPTSRIFNYLYDHIIYKCYFCKECVNNNKYIDLYTKDILIKIYNHT